ncbi:hypothetical protein NDN01_02770 [Sphingomonas sp. QA11]|uniref:hypothetical protein n=1 Tax=Sphingomonas sp. QA11 TaxID=2950605 RepID=UPI00234B906F|nr:hypothetical protein [Sphingomonas sp. QA11]WCM27872.1 hypothetical protein NDN01_02770 [Sphingomonas sp. QA11]
MYRRFPFKLVLFGSAIRQVREDTNKRFADFSISSRGNALECLYAAMRWLYDVNLEPRLIAYRRIAFSEAAVVGKGLAQEPSPISDSLIELISEAQVDGLLLPADPAKILRLLFDAVIIGRVMRAMSVTGDEANVALQEQEFQNNWAMLITGLEPR